MTQINIMKLLRNQIFKSTLYNNFLKFKIRIIIHKHQEKLEGNHQTLKENYFIISVPKIK